MTTTTVHASTNDGWITSTHATYATARAGAGLAADTTNSVFVIEDYSNVVSDFMLSQAFLEFDVSTIPPGDVITAVTLDLWLVNSAVSDHFTIEARVFDFGGTVTTGDWQASLAALTRVATFDTSTLGSTGAYKAFTEDGSNFAAAVQASISGGVLRLVVASGRLATGTTPGIGIGGVTFSSADQSGTSQDPKLTVTHSTPVPPVPPVPVQSPPTYFEHLDVDGNRLGVLHPTTPGTLNLQTGTAASRWITGMLLTGTDAETFDPYSHRVAVTIDGTPIGTFIPTYATPTDTIGRSLQLDLHDPGHFLNFPLNESFSAVRGANVADVARQILAGTGATAEVPATTAELGQWLAWPSVYATPAQVLATLMGLAGWSATWVDPDGVIHVGYAALPGVDPVTHVWSMNDLKSVAPETIDLFAVPNRHRVTSVNGSIIVTGSYDLPASDPRSASRRGRVVTATVERPGLATTGEANEAARVQAMRTAGKHVEFDADIDPTLAPNTLHRYRGEDIALTSMSAPLDPGALMHVVLSDATPETPGSTQQPVLLRGTVTSYSSPLVTVRIGGDAGTVVVPDSTVISWSPGDLAVVRFDPEGIAYAVARS